MGHCVCPSNFIGQTCQTPAQPLSALPKERTIGQNYSYFFFEPQEVNFYRLNFSICMKSNPSNTPTLFFVIT